jgi:hypothetical protein
VIITGLFMSLVVSGDALYYYQYMHIFTFENILILIGHLSLMTGVLILRKKLSFYKEPFYIKRLAYINLFVHFQIVVIHFLRDTDFINQYISYNDEYYYQSIFMTSFVFYLLMIVSSVFYENRRAEEKELFHELKLKQDDLRYLFETRPYRLIEELKELSENGEYEKVLLKTSNYMGVKKKEAHKRVLDKLDDDLLAYVTMETIHKEKNVAFEVVVENQSTRKFSKQNYFLEMYGIVLDNAVEAAKKANLRYVKIVFDEDKVIVENSYTEDDALQLKDKVSLKGYNRRINGLKLLSYLEEESNIQISVEISYRVIVSLEVEYA